MGGDGAPRAAAHAPARGHRGRRRCDARQLRRRRRRRSARGGGGELPQGAGAAGRMGMAAVLNGRETAQQQQQQQQQQDAARGCAAPRRRLGAGSPRAAAAAAAHHPPPGWGGGHGGRGRQAPRRRSRATPTSRSSTATSPRTTTTCCCGSTRSEAAKKKRTARANAKVIEQLRCASYAQTEAREDNNCAVCLEPSRAQQAVLHRRAASTRGATCIIKWLKQSDAPTCPVCKAPRTPPDGGPESDAGAASTHADEECWSTRAQSLYVHPSPR